MPPQHQQSVYAQAAASLLASCCAASPPDLSNVAVIAPSESACREFILALGQQLPENVAIIPPWCGSLRSWVLAHVDSPHPDRTLINEYARQCIFIDALDNYQHLFSYENPWQLAHTLLQLFDELNLSPGSMLEDEADWYQQLRTAYGISDGSLNDTISAQLGMESKLVYTLWHAWNRQLAEHGCIDTTLDYCTRLLEIIEQAQSGTTPPACLPEKMVYIGDMPTSGLDRQLLQTLAGMDRLEHYQQLPLAMDEPSGSPAEALFRLALQDNDKAIAERAHRLRDELASASHGERISAPLFRAYLAQDDEDQVMAIDLFIRQQVLNGKTRIAVISEDRKLSRRLRAVLERSNIQITDQSGWSLATTQAASVIERWLQCIEEDFNAYALLAVLKSSFVRLYPGTEDRYNYLRNVYRLQQDIILHENVSGNIDAYKTAMADRLQRLKNWPQNSYAELAGLLEQLQQVAADMRELHAGSDRIKLADFISGLRTCLQQMGTIDLYREDAAGRLILDSLDQIELGLDQASKQSASPRLGWNDCRSWLSMALESRQFSPPVDGQPLVSLMTLEQADYQYYDACVIAACDSQAYPGSAPAHPLFNQAVRISLGLPSWSQAYAQRQQQFCRRLVNSEQLLLAATNMEKGEEKPVSPWLELLLQCHELVTGHSAVDHSLSRYREIEQLASQQQTSGWQLERPATAAPPQLVPGEFSASSYQRLINCPYQFFVADMLGIKAQDELATELKKSDYGERVHRILQLFHRQTPESRSAFSDSITQDNRERAVQHLEKLSYRVFLEDMQDNVLHRSWFFRWKKIIPAYIDWQINQQQAWQILDTECDLAAELAIAANGNAGTTTTTSIRGRLDRVDQSLHDHGHAIIDYKTGACPKQADVDSGEDVQLATYSLLDPKADEMTYLLVDSSKQEVKSQASLAGDALQQAAQQNTARLAEMITMLNQAAAMPAWGDEKVCGYCRFKGVCRKQYWS